MSIFDQASFTFPYHYKFPGQASDERILFVTRENHSMLWLRLLSIMTVGAFTIWLGWWLADVLSDTTAAGYSAAGFAGILRLITSVLAITFMVVGGWWVYTLWRKSLAMLTTQRFVKFIYTTPFNRHILSLPLEMIVDTGAYTKGFFQAIFKLGTFTARSSASSSGIATDDPRGERINKKYFFIENIAAAEDLQHYVNKLLAAFRHSHAKLDTFRPFLPDLKGESRKQFMQQYPEYWS